jgi:hypothetical protein
MIIIGGGQCCDLEDLAGARVHTELFTRMFFTIFCLLRFVLLIAVAGLKARFLCVSVILVCDKAQRLPKRYLLSDGSLRQVLPSASKGHYKTSSELEEFVPANLCRP